MSHALTDRSSRNREAEPLLLRIPDLSRIDEDVTVPLLDRTPTAEPTAALSQAESPAPAATAAPAAAASAAPPTPLVKDEPKTASRAKRAWLGLMQVESSRQMLTLAGLGLLIGLSIAVAAQAKRRGATASPTSAGVVEKATAEGDGVMQNKRAKSVARDGRRRKQADDPAPVEAADAADDVNGPALGPHSSLGSDGRRRVARRNAQPGGASVELTGTIEPAPR